MPKSVGEHSLPELIKALRKGMKPDLDTINEGIVGVKKELVEDRKAVEALSARVTSSEDMLGKLQTDLDQIKASEAKSIEDVAREIFPKVTDFVTTSLGSQWGELLVEEIRKHECGLLVNGLRLHAGQPAAEFRKFCLMDLHMPPEKANDLKIIEVTKLGQDRLGRPATLLVKMSHPSERNECMKLSKNLQRGISFDLFVPKRYLQKYRDFKEEAWKLRVTKGVQTFIGFKSFGLQLKFKKRDDQNIKYDWTIYDEFIPKPTIGEVPIGWARLNSDWPIGL